MAISKKNLRESFSRPTSNLLVLANKADIQPALAIIFKKNVSYLCFGTSIFIQADSYGTTLDLQDELKEGNFQYTFIVISNPDGSLVSAPHLKPADAVLIRDLLLMGSF